MNYYLYTLVTTLTDMLPATAQQYSQELMAGYYAQIIIMLTMLLLFLLYTHNILQLPIQQPMIENDSYQQKIKLTDKVKNKFKHQ